MSNQIKTIVKTNSKDIAHRKEIKLRKHLNADALFTTMKTGFDKIEDYRPGNVQHALGDALMSGFVMFSLNDPSLLAFGVFADLTNEGLNHRIISGLFTAWAAYRAVPPCVKFSTVLDPNDLRPLFKDAFRQLQRGKALEQMVFMQGCYLLNLDGTGYFSSSQLYSDACMKKVSRSGKVTWYLHAVGRPLSIRISRQLSPTILK